MIDSYLKELLKKYNLKLVFEDIDYPGYIVASEGNVPNLLVVNQSIDDTQEIENIILHEIGHFISDDTSDDIDYEKNPNTRCRSEHNANKYLTTEMAKRYAMSVDEESANYLDLAEYLKMKDTDMVKKVLQNEYNLKRKPKSAVSL